MFFFLICMQLFLSKNCKKKKKQTNNGNEDIFLSTRKSVSFVARFDFAFQMEESGEDTFRDEEENVRQEILKWIRDQASEIDVDETSSLEELKGVLVRISSTTEKMIAVKTSEIYALKDYMNDEIAQLGTIIGEMQTTFDSYEEDEEETEQDFTA